MRERIEVPAGPEDRFTEGSFVIIQAAKHSVGITRLRNGELKAVRNWCPHKGAPICLGTLSGTWPPSAPGDLQYDSAMEVLVCPWHGFEYDLQDGRELYRERPTRLSFLPLIVRNGCVYVIV